MLENTPEWIIVLASGFVGWVVRSLLEQHNAVRRRIIEKRADDWISIVDRIDSIRRPFDESIYFIASNGTEHSIPEFYTPEGRNQFIKETHDFISSVESLGLLDNESSHRIRLGGRAVLDVYTGEAAATDSSPDSGHAFRLRDVQCGASELDHVRRKLQRRVGYSEYSGLAAAGSYLASLWSWGVGDIRRAMRAYVRGKIMKLIASERLPGVVCIIWDLGHGIIHGERKTGSIVHIVVRHYTAERKKARNDKAARLEK